MSQTEKDLATLGRLVGAKGAVEAEAAFDRVVAELARLHEARAVIEALRGAVLLTRTMSVPPTEEQRAAQAMLRRFVEGGRIG